MKKRIIKAGIFTVILFLMIYLLGFVFQPKNNNHYAGVFNDDLDGFGVMAEPEYSLDAVFIGDSEAYCAFNPFRIWERSGISTYVVSSVDQHTYKTEEYLKMAHRNQNPKIVIMETNALYRGSSRIDSIKSEITYVFPLFYYHDRWKSLHCNDWYSKPVYTNTDITKGYSPKGEIESADISNYMDPTDEVEKIPSENLRHLRNMVNFCRARGEMFWLVSTPSTQNWDYARHNAVAQAAEELDIPYFDLNEIADVLNIDWTQDTMDAGDHMNFYGALKVTDYMTKLLQETGLFVDKRQQPESEYWDDLFDRFYEKCLEKGIDLQKSQGWN